MAYQTNVVKETVTTEIQTVQLTMFGWSNVSLKICLWETFIRHFFPVFVVWYLEMWKDKNLYIYPWLQMDIVEMNIHEEDLISHLLEQELFQVFWVGLHHKQLHSAETWKSRWVKLEERQAGKKYEVSTNLQFYYLELKWKPISNNNIMGWKRKWR